MRLMQRLAGLLVLFALSAAVLISVDPAFGQTSSSPVEQLMQGLGPDQLQSLTQQLGVGGAGAQNATTIRPQPYSEEQQDMMLRQQRDMLIEAQRQRTEAQRLSPFLQAEDWVVVTVDYNPLPAGNPAPPPPSAAVQAALGGATGQQQNILSSLPPGVPGANQAALAGASGAVGGAGAAAAGANAQNAALAAATAAAMAPSPAQGVNAGG